MLDFDFSKKGILRLPYFLDYLVRPFLFFKICLNYLCNSFFIIPWLFYDGILLIRLSRIQISIILSLLFLFFFYVNIIDLDILRLG